MHELASPGYFGPTHRRIHQVFVKRKLAGDELAVTPGILNTGIYPPGESAIVRRALHQTTCYDLLLQSRYTAADMVTVTLGATAAGWLGLVATGAIGFQDRQEVAHVQGRIDTQKRIGISRSRIELMTVRAILQLRLDQMGRVRKSCK